MSDGESVVRPENFLSRRQCSSPLPTTHGFISKRIGTVTPLFSSRISRASTASQLTTIEFDLQDLVATVTKLRADLASMRELRTNMDQSVQDTIAATRIIDAFKAPRSSQQSVWFKNYAAFPME